MKRTWILFGILAVGLYMIGCASPQDKAQKLFNAGKYEEVVAQFGTDPNLTGLVAQAKEKLAEGLLAEGKFEDVIAAYPETVAAKEARNKIAEKLFNEKKYQEVLDKYADTPAAQLAKLELEKAQGGNGTAPATDGKGGKGGNTEEVKAKNAAAQAELDRILNIKVPNLREKALREFVANAKFAGTDAAKKAEGMLKK